MHPIEEEEMPRAHAESDKPLSFQELYHQYVESDEYLYLEKLPSHETLSLQTDFESAMDRIMTSCGLCAELNDSGCKVYPPLVGGEHAIRPITILASCFDNLFGQLDAKGCGEENDDDDDAAGGGDVGSDGDGTNDDDVD